MKITTSKKSLSSALASVKGAADPRSTMRILACALLTAKDGTLTVCATDLSLTRTALLECEGDTFAVAVDVKALAERVAAMPDGPVTLEAKGDRLMLSSGTSKRRYALATLPAEDFPPLPDTEGETYYSIEAKAIVAGISAVRDAISNDETRPHLNSLLVEWKKHSLRFVATDGHRLHMIDQKTEGSATLSLLITKRSALDLASFASSVGDGVITLAMAGESVASFRAPDGKSALSTKLTAATFPPYEQIIPKEQPNTATVTRTALIEAARAASLSVNARTGGIHVILGADAMTVFASSSEAGDAHDEVPMAYEGAPLTVGVNAEYLIAALAMLDSEEAVLGFGADLDPITVRKPGKKSEAMAVVMPMRVG